MEADVIVVGGGSAGCAVAARLAETGNLRVLLLEAGKAALDLKTTVPAMVAQVVMNPAYDWMYPVEPDASLAGQPSFWPAGKVLGGGSAINGMMFVRGHAADYDRWAELGARGWAYDDCLPYFRRMEANPRGGVFHGSSGPVRVSESGLSYPLTEQWMASAEAAGIARAEDLNGNGREAVGVDRVQASQWHGRRWSSADAYLRGNRRPPKLEILDGVRVERIVLGEGRAKGVIARRADGSRLTLRARAGVVISAGTIATPKLLMLSGIGPAAELARLGGEVVRDLPGVGHNLQDHVGVNLAWSVHGASINSQMRGLGPAKALLRYLLQRKGMLSAAISNAHALVRLDADRPAPSVQLAFSPFSFDIMPDGQRVMPKQSMISNLVGVLHPGARGSIRLRALDPDAPPLIEHELLADPRDLDLLVQGIALSRAIMAARPIADNVLDETKPSQSIVGAELEAWIRANAISLFHPVGTARMGTDENAVVDPDLAVHGVGGLWVADCSIAPELISGNTNAAAIMIGDKAADHIMKTLSGLG
ncbi:GMC family oxidoreductase [Tsuneonella sp. HG222]